MTSPVRRMWADLRAQWEGNARLRVGMLAIVGILWLYGLLVAGDAVQALQSENARLRGELDTLRPLAQDKTWSARAADAARQVAALQSMTWREGEIGLVEASLQDWLTVTATKAGLRTTEVKVARAAMPAAAAASAAASAPQVVQARVNAEFQTLGLMGLLVEVGRSERSVLIDRLAIRLASQPPTAELDLHALATTGKPAGGP